MKKFEEVILHIGAEKTGSTAIQRFLFRNREQLLRRGYLYPVTLGKKNHTGLAIFVADLGKGLGRFREIYDEKKLNEFRITLNAEFLHECSKADAKRLIISNEWLCPRIDTDDEFYRLRGILYQFTDTVKIILYIRRQDQLVSSLYSTAIRAGSTNIFSFPNIKPRLQTLPYWLDYFAIAEKWCNAFNEATLRIRIYSKVDFFNGNLIEDFCATSNIPFSEEAYYRDEIVNRSIDVSGQEILRTFNEIRKNRNLTKSCIRDFVRLVEQEFTGTGVRAARKDAIAFFENFQLANEKLRQQFFPARQTLFDNDFSNYYEDSLEIDEDFIATKLKTLMEQAGIPN